MGAMASQITSLTIVYSTVYSGADQRKRQSSASLAFVGEITGVNSPHIWPVARKMLPLDDVIMKSYMHGHYRETVWEALDEILKANIKYAYSNYADWYHEIAIISIDREK